VAFLIPQCWDQGCAMAPRGGPNPGHASPALLSPFLRLDTDADCAPLARVWRRAWGFANPSVASVAPPDHWEARCVPSVARRA